jgi:hypothetical protein
MEPHDVVLAKCAAGRQRDWDFARAAVELSVVELDELVRRANDLPLPEERRLHVVRLLEAFRSPPLGSRRSP